MKKLIIFIIMLLIFLASCGIGYFYLNTREDQRNDSKPDEGVTVIKNNIENETISTETAEEKIHKGDGDTSFVCRRTTDILKTLGENKKDGQVLIGFSMETENMIERTRTKLTKKNCDYICANNLKEEGAGFGTDTNHIVILSEDGMHDLPLASKYTTACSILKYCLKGE